MFLTWAIYLVLGAIGCAAGLVGLVFLGRCVWLVLNHDLLRRRAHNGVEYLRDDLATSTSNVEAKVPGQLRDELGWMQKCLDQGTELIQKAQSSWIAVYSTHLYWQAGRILEAGSWMSSHIFVEIQILRGSKNYRRGELKPLTFGQRVWELWRDIYRSIEYRLPWGLIISSNMYFQIIWGLLRFNFFMLRWALLGLLVAGVVVGSLLGGIFFMAHGIGAIIGLAVALQVSVLILAISVFICLK